ncbi:MAG: ATP-dependent DNA helicase RecG [Caldilineaceae bacterium]|nr:ATP-dependent DNA helicase RecG [Caldilineaceae bacterium]
MQRILDLEERQGWRNRAVIGGLLAMGNRWSDDALAESISEEQVAAILLLMTRYEEEDQDARPDTAAAIRAVLAGEIADDVRTLMAEDDKSASAAATAAEDEATDDAAADYAGDDDDDEIINLPPPEPTDVARRRARERAAGRAQTNVAPHDLQASPEILAGVGPARAEQLARLGITQVIDLLWHLPARYDDFSKLRTISQLQPGEQATVVANLWDIRERKIGINRQIVQGILADGTGTLHATWWNKWVTKQLTTGTTMRFSGKVGLYMGQKTLDNPVFEDIDADMVATGRLSPVYPLTEGIAGKWLRDLIRTTLDTYSRFLADPLPDSIRAQYDLPDLATALEQVHMPDDQDALDKARRRLAFEELFYVQLGVLQRRRELQSVTATPIVDTADAVAAFQAALPFELTGAQQRVLAEVMQDMARSVPMTRLVQGDVGSGKTAVAAATMLVTAGNGLQAAMLAPTQILAEQHHAGISRMLASLEKPDGSPVTVALLTGRVTGNERQAVLDGLRDGSIDLVVGTTALIQEQVEFDNLGLVIVDEQHRFGVEQRGALRTKSSNQPHLLVMSATPIPRSLALTIYGDLDLSIIDEMPPGRIPITTVLFTPSERERVYGFMRSEAQEGRQSYVIYPLVEESDSLDVGSAVEGHQRLQDEIFPDLRVALLHGRMTGSEKDAVMTAFAGGDYDILVSTTVIEVGIDVPNATVMVIEDAERFGLAQLHQLRGRVGRGQQKSYCVLVSKATADAAQERLTALRDSNNGFVLAEKDLDLRGPGDFLGTRQSGLPALRIASLSDMETLLLAREAGQQLFADDPELAQYPDLARQVTRFWRGHGDVN